MRGRLTLDFVPGRYHASVVLTLIFVPGLDRLVHSITWGLGIAAGSCLPLSKYCFTMTSATQACENRGMGPASPATWTEILPNPLDPSRGDQGPAPAF